MINFWKFMFAFFVTFSLIVIAGVSFILFASSIEWLIYPELSAFVPLSGVVFDELINFLNARATPIVIIAVLIAWIEVRNNFAKGILDLIEKIRELKLLNLIEARIDEGAKGKGTITDAPEWSGVEGAKPDESSVAKPSAKKPRSRKPTAKKPVAESSD